MHLPLLLPTDAERVRSVLAAAHSMTVVTDGQRTEIRHLDGTDPLGRLHLHPAEPGGGAEHRPAIRLEFTDIAPTPVRDRVRARVTLVGRLLTPFAASADEGSGSTCMEFGRAVLETADGARSYVGLDELDAARVDPLAPYEAGMLTHLLDDHAELVTLLLRLVRPQPATEAQSKAGAGSAVLRALPLAMDRYGITLRLEERRGHQDVRIPFPSPLDDVEQSGAQIQALFSAARRSSHRNTLPA
ncbi:MULTISPECIES: DUF2470 domain-containing protein [unclassified Streptomyces]|uniref:DUF2470 domain-containing protein n=1 Tax=unclassified Streptomyces TaxID=2593676 RepID=UPI00202DD95F|nr:MULTISPECIES: DUF2470 domain-containing protein [unclassified Streptomyces]MCM1968424.1 DUF2470 domain-containing protein [Streptomyces sp. G1]MCX5127339.1 DUF2470 domain-containing protein [Streptomyces sp. NBC_00347]MCX5295241.1 DUF2470 domain-containing protein [Streptomyces sp. NBC_00193]